MELLNHYRRKGLGEARNDAPSGSSAVERHYIPLHPRSASHWVIVRMPLAVSVLRRSLQVINGWKWRGLCLLGEWRVIGARAGSAALEANGSHDAFRWQQHGVKLKIAIFFFFFFSNVAQILLREGQDANVAFFLRFSDSLQVAGRSPNDAVRDYIKLNSGDKIWETVCYEQLFGRVIWGLKSFQIRIWLML